VTQHGSFPEKHIGIAHWKSTLEKHIGKAHWKSTLDKKKRQILSLWSNVHEKDQNTGLDTFNTQRYTSMCFHVVVGSGSYTTGTTSTTKSINHVPTPWWPVQHDRVGLGKCVRSVLEKCWKCVRNVCWKYVGHVLDMCWTCVESVLVVCSVVCWGSCLSYIGTWLVQTAPCFDGTSGFRPGGREAVARARTGAWYWWW
jgi:hypothetical protein